MLSVLCIVTWLSYGIAMAIYKNIGVKLAFFFIRTRHGQKHALVVATSDKGIDKEHEKKNGRN